MRAGAQGATVILRLCAVRQVGSTLVSVLERYAKKLHHNGAQLVLTKLNEWVYGQLTKTETIESIGGSIDLIVPRRKFSRLPAGRCGMRRSRSARLWGIFQRQIETREQGQIKKGNGVCHFAVFKR